jgi:hypothetical protein
MKTELWLEDRQYATLQVPDFVPQKGDELVLPSPSGGYLRFRVFSRVFHPANTRDDDVLRLYVDPVR